MTPYAYTTVPVAKTQDAIRHLLIMHGAQRLGFIEDWAANTLGFSFVHVKKFTNDDGNKAELPMTVRMVIQVWPDPKQRLKASQEKAAQRQRQVWRALYHYLKSQLESVEFGLRTFEDAFLADLVASDGRTIGDVMREGLSHGKIQLQLPAPN